MNNQEIFNKVWKGLKSQGWQRSVRGEKCLYRGPDGLKCAIGHLIPDEHYWKEMEGKTVYTLMDTYPNLNLSTMNLGFLDSLQTIHDLSWECTPQELEEKYRRFARDQGLTIPED